MVDERINLEDAIKSVSEELAAARPTPAADRESSPSEATVQDAPTGEESPSTLGPAAESQPVQTAAPPRNEPTAYEVLLARHSDALAHIKHIEAEKENLMGLLSLAISNVGKAAVQAQPSSVPVLDAQTQAVSALLDRLNSVEDRLEEAKTAAEPTGPDARDDEIAELKAQNQSLSEQIEGLRYQSEAPDARDEQITELRAQIEELSKEPEGPDPRDEQIAELHAQIEELSKEPEGPDPKDEQITELNTQVQTLVAQLEQATAQPTGPDPRDEEIIELRAHMQTLAAQLEEATTEPEGPDPKDEQIADLQAQMMTLVTQLEEAREGAAPEGPDPRDEELERLRSQNQNLTDQLVSANDQLDDLRLGQIVEEAEEEQQDEDSSSDDNDNSLFLKYFRRRR